MTPTKPFLPDAIVDMAVAAAIEGRYIRTLSANKATISYCVVFSINGLSATLKLINLNLGDDWKLSIHSECFINGIQIDSVFSQRERIFFAIKTHCDKLEEEKQANDAIRLHKIFQSLGLK